MGTSTSTTSLTVGGTVTLRNASVTTTTTTGTSTNKTSDMTFYVFGNNYGYSTSITGDPTLLTVPQIIAYSQVPVFQIKVNASFFIHRQSDGSYAYVNGSAAVDSVTVLTGSVTNPDGSTSRYNGSNGITAAITLTSSIITGGVTVTTSYDSNNQPMRYPTFLLAGTFGFNDVTGKGSLGNYIIDSAAVNDSTFPKLENVGGNDYRGRAGLYGSALVGDKGTVYSPYVTKQSGPWMTFSNIAVDRYDPVSAGIVKMVMRSPDLKSVTDFYYQIGTGDAGSGGPISLSGLKNV